MLHMVGHGKEWQRGEMNYKAVVQYEGTRYRGWQVQGNTQNTIQGKLEELLSQMEGNVVEVHGSGRTDAGVQAQHISPEMIEAFLEEQAQRGRKDSSLCNYRRILQELYRYLPADIGVVSIEEAEPRFHARLWAIRKRYVYRIWNSALPDVFGRRFSVPVLEKLDVEAMREAAGF